MGQEILMGALMVNRGIFLNIIIFGFDSQPEGLGVAFFATGPGSGLIMYIFTTLEFPTHNADLYLFFQMPH